MHFFEFMTIPVILFMVIVAPIWLTFHYRSLNRANRGLNEEDRKSIEHMLETVDKLTDRISTLESILDADHAGWRQPEKPTEHGGRQT